MFFEKIFYLDPKLPKILFNKLRRIIIENEGTRISSITDDVNYIVTLDYNSYREYQSKLIYYQFIFDCKESKSLLYPEFYIVFEHFTGKILSDYVVVIDKKINAYNELVNKFKSLGAIIKSDLSTRVTHYISKNPDQNLLKIFARSVELKAIKKKDKFNDLNLPFRIVNPDWCDQCLISLKALKETKYMVNRLSLNVRNKAKASTSNNRILFQFTSLPTYFKDKAIKKFEKYNIPYLESDKFENCTHLIAGAINSSEKFFSGIASGCWILRPDFIQDFENQLNFEYEKYEWASTPDMTSKDQKIAQAIKKWRMKIQNDGIRPFYKWNVKIYCSDDKKENYANFITNGGGTMNSSWEYSHVFVDKGFESMTKEPKVKTIDYIFSYLLLK